MAKDPENNINYYLLIEEQNKEYLSAIRAWDNIKLAFDGDKIWATGFDNEQIHAKEVLCIPSKQLFYEKAGKLFFVGSVLPEQNVPSVLWTPINRAIPIKKTLYNHNFFGIDEKIPFKLIESDNEHKAIGMFLDIKVLEEYIITAPHIRMQQLKWTIIDETSAFIIGEPLLPLQAEVFWKCDNAFIPAGYDFEFPSFYKSILENISADQSTYIVFDKSGSHFLIPDSAFSELSIYGVREYIQSNF